MEFAVFPNDHFSGPGAAGEVTEEGEEESDDESDDESLVKEPGVTLEDDASLAPDVSVRTKSSKSKKSSKSSRSKFVSPARPLFTFLPDLL